MSTTVTYKGSTLATVNNNTKTLKTAGKYMEGDVVLTDVSGGTAAISVVDTADSHGGTIREITALDISDTTAVASDVASGKYFYDALGVLTQGSASGGGGGLEYETGTWTPTENIVNPTINYNDTHTIPPMSIIFYDATGTEDSTTGTNYAFAWVDYSQIGNMGMIISSTKTEYARAFYTAKTSSTSVTCWSYGIIYPYSNTSASSDTYYRYWVTESGFKPSAIATTRYWIAGRTYKWIAVWAPTT